VLLFAATAHSQYQWSAIDDFDRTLRKYGQLWDAKEFEKWRRLDVRQHQPWEPCRTHPDTWGHLHAAVPRFRSWYAREDSNFANVHREWFDLLVYSRQTASEVCIAVDSTLSDGPSAPGRFGSESGDTSVAIASTLDQGMAAIRDRNGAADDPLTKWKALLYLAVLRGDSTTLFDVIDQCSVDRAPCAEWRTWAHRTVTPTRRIPVPYPTAASRLLESTCLGALRDAPIFSREFSCRPTPDPSIFWWAADPFWSTPGNERRDAQIDRALLLDLVAVLRWGGVFDWREQAGGDALREAMVRYGWPRAVRPSSRHFENTIKVAEHFRLTYSTAPSQGPSHTWVYGGNISAAVPVTSTASEPSRWDQADWSTVVRRRTDSLAHALQHMPEWWAPPCPITDIVLGQRAVLRRTRTHLMLATTTSAALEGMTLTSSRGPHHADYTQPIRWHPARSTVALAAVDTGAVAFSFERPFRDGCVPYAARVRFGQQTVALPAAQSFALSAPVLLHERPQATAMAITDSAAFSLAAPSTDVASGSPLVTYFEVYGAPSDSLQLTITLRPRLAVGIVRRLGVRAGVAADPNATSSVSFDASSRSSDRVRIADARTGDFGLVIELSTLGLRPGDYEVEVSAESRTVGRVAQAIAVQVR
jgi:hypothetical protein